MKRYLMLIAAALMLLVSCEEPPTVITEQSSNYVGTMMVGYEGDEFVQSGVSVKAELHPDGAAMDLKLEKVKFVPAMPIRIDVTIMDIPVEVSSDGTVMFSADAVTPWTMGGPYDTYRVDDLSGFIKEARISFSLDFFNPRTNAGYPTAFEGTKN